MSERAWRSCPLAVRRARPRGAAASRPAPRAGPWTVGEMAFAPRESPTDTSFKAVLLDREMRVLLGTNPRGECELLGGRAEAQDASPQDTVRREVREEAGIDIVVGAIVDSWFYDIPGKGRVAVTSYLARPVGDVSLALGTEHADWACADEREPLHSSQLPHNVPPQSRSWRAVIGAATRFQVHSPRLYCSQRAEAEPRG